MMGVVSQGPVYYDLFEEFADLATQGMCPIGAPDERGHKDGWGLACFQDGALKVYMRDAGPAAGASKYYGSAWKIAKLNAERAAGHSLIVERNGATWAFQHNGSLVADSGESGKVDSQILFDMILSSLRGPSHEDVAKATTVARDLAIAKHGGFTSLNFMLSDGRALHFYRDFQTNGQYYTLYLDNFGEMIIAASEPILNMKAEPIPRGVLTTVTPELEIQRSAIS